MPYEYDYPGLANHLLARIRSILPELLPGGHVNGKEYCCGDLRGGLGDSCRINMETGMWCDFAGPDEHRGGDVISLYAKIYDKKQADAFKELADKYGFSYEKKSVEVVKNPRWTYHDRDGNPILIIERTDSPSKGKQFYPSYFNGEKWVKKQHPKPRPLYNLHKLASRPSAPVLICEGEKSCDAAEILLQNKYVCTTWPGGSKAAHLAEWSVLNGRKHIVIWPDADEAGITAANIIAAKLNPHCETVKIINVNGRPVGWDANDALMSGMDLNSFSEWAAPRAHVFHVDVNVNVSEDPGQFTGSHFALWEEIGLPLMGNGTPIINIDCVCRLIAKHFNEVAWYDTFLQRIMTENNREWTDIDTLQLCLKVQRDFGISKMSDEIIHKAIRIVAKNNEKNAPRDWFDSLKWDKRSRIERFFIEYFGTPENNYYLSISKNWWISMVARIYEPGCQMDNMIILKGKQGAFKSSALRVIGGNWYTSCGHNVLSKEFYQILQGKLIIEIGEMDSFNRSEVNTIKDVVATPTDRYRTPYDKYPDDHPRQCVFVGTTNEDLILKDYTGGRRFWPVDVSFIKLDGIKANRDQFFAEAVHLYKSGIPWHEVPIEETEMVQEDNREQDDWEEYLNEYILTHNLDEFKLIDLARDCLKISVDKFDRKTQLRMARCLKVIGWKSIVIRKNNTTIRRWVTNNREA